MAKWYAEIKGSSKTPATKQGTETSGMSAHIRGWSFGVNVECFVEKDGREYIQVQRTGGSNDPKARGTLIIIDDNGMRTMK